MNDITSRNFGLLIAYLVPGFVALLGTSCLSEPLRTLIVPSTTELPTISGFFYITVATVAAGMTVSTVRWLVIDKVHYWTGIKQPDWDFARLQEKIMAFEQLIEIHYRYYQFYANMVVSVVFAYTMWRWSAGGIWPQWTDLGFLLLVTSFYLGSRDTLRKYYDRVALLLGTRSAAAEGA